jgi:hypothetical protein
MTLKERAKKHSSGIALTALLASLAGPTISYLEARSQAKAATAQAQAAQATATKRTGVVEGTQSAMYQLLVSQLERVAKDADACHERVDALSKAVQGVATNTRRGGRRGAANYAGVASEMVQQASVVRPRGAKLPRRKSDVAKGDPLAGALK